MANRVSLAMTRSGLTTWEWTDADYEQMGWHDATVHAFAASPDTYEFLGLSFSRTLFKVTT